MKLRNTAIAAALSLMPFGQSLVIGTSAALMIAVPEQAQAESAFFYLNRGKNKGNAGDWYGAISDITKAIEMNPPRDQLAWAYFGRGAAKQQIRNFKGACSDFRKAASLGHKNAANSVRKEC